MIETLAPTLCQNCKWFFKLPFTLQIFSPDSNSQSFMQFPGGSSRDEIWLEWKYLSSYVSASLSGIISCEWAGLSPVAISFTTKHVPPVLLGGRVEILLLSFWMVDAVALLVFCSREVFPCWIFRHWLFAGLDGGSLVVVADDLWFVRLMFCFWSACLSAVFILRSSSESLARSSERYPSTVPQPAILRSLFRFPISSW